MIKRTPQEIADFFQGYVAQDRDGKWYIYFEKPVLGPDLWISAGGMAISLNRFIKEEFEHSWTTLYEPRDITPKSGNINEESGKNCQKSDLYPYLPVANDSGINVKSCCPDFKDSGSKDSAPHQSQVHTHQEYVVAEAKRAQDLAKKVNVMLDHGWKPQGGIAIEYLPESDGYPEGSEIFYQALTRGIA